MIPSVRARSASEGWRRRTRVATMLASMCALPSCASHNRHTGEHIETARQAISRTLDELHAAAARADEDDYFALFAPNAVFLGTDDSERWTVEEFRAYAHPFFSQGRGWTYTPVERHVAFSRDGETAWYDEKLDNVKWGRCRGSGVLVKTSGGWKVAQYNLTVPIPNDLLPEIAERIKTFESQRSLDSRPR